VVGDSHVVAALANNQDVDLQYFDESRIAIDQLRDGKVAAVVVSQNDTIDVRYADGDRAETGPALVKISDAVASANLGAGTTPPKYAMRQKPIEETAFKPIQYLTPGILSWGVSTAAVFSSALTLVAWRRKQVLRRIQLAPIGRTSVLTSRLLLATTISLLQAVLFVSVAMLPVFGLQLSNQWWLSIPLLILGTFAFFSVGMLLGAVCRTEDSVTGAANLVVLPMALLAGSFFPIDKAPEWVKFITNALPLRHMNEGMLDVLVRGRDIGSSASRPRRIARPSVSVRSTTRCSARPSHWPRATGWCSPDGCPSRLSRGSPTTSCSARSSCPARRSSNSPCTRGSRSTATSSKNSPSKPR
jgi:ABC-2 type transport system permease protein